MTGMMILILVLGVVVISEVKSQGGRRRCRGGDIWNSRLKTCIRRPTPGETQAADQVSTTVSPTTASVCGQCKSNDDCSVICPTCMPVRGPYGKCTPTEGKGSESADDDSHCYIHPDCDKNNICPLDFNCCFDHYCCRNLAERCPLSELHATSFVRGTSISKSWCYPDVFVTNKLDVKISGEVQMAAGSSDAYYTNLESETTYVHDRGCWSLLTGVTAHFTDEDGNQLDCIPYSSSGTSFGNYEVKTAPGQPAAGCKVVRV